jgi:hypothetical protein
MKHRSWLFAVILIFFVSCTPQNIAALQAASSTAAVNPISIALSTTSDHYKLDAPIPVVITLTNATKIPTHLRIYVVPDGAYQSLGLQFSLTLDANKVPRTAFHRAIRGESLRDESLRGETSSGKSPSGSSGVIVDGSFQTYIMGPGQSDQLRIDVKKLFAMTRPGSYMFSVEMPVNRDSKVEIHSQPLLLNVVP